MTLKDLNSYYHENENRLIFKEIPFDLNGYFDLKADCEHRFYFMSSPAADMAYICAVNVYGIITAFKEINGSIPAKNLAC